MTHPTGARTEPPRRAKHLMHPANPRAAHAPRGTMTLTTVQMWVMSVLAVSTLLHMSLGVIGAAFYVDDDRLDAQIGLLVIAGVFGVGSVVAGAAIHRKRLVTPWLALGAVPAAVAAYFLL